MNEIFSRASVRQFEPRPVEQEKVEQLLRAAMAAPSARNQQPWEFYAVTNRETLDALAACSLYALSLKGAPLGIVICCRRNCSRPEYAQIDCSAAADDRKFVGILSDAAEAFEGADVYPLGLQANFFPLPREAVGAHAVDALGAVGGWQLVDVVAKAG